MASIALTAGTGGFHLTQFLQNRAAALQKMDREVR